MTTVLIKMLNCTLNKDDKLPQIVCYGSGACLTYLQQQLTPPDEPPEGGSKRKGQMVNRLKADFFGGARSPPLASKRHAVV